MTVLSEAYLVYHGFKRFQWKASKYIFHFECHDKWSTVMMKQYKGYASCLTIHHMIHFTHDRDISLMMRQFKGYASYFSIHHMIQFTHDRDISFISCFFYFVNMYNLKKKNPLFLNSSYGICGSLDIRCCFSRWKKFL